MGKRRLLQVPLVAVVVVAAAYGFWWWRVQEMDSQRCAAALQAVGAAAGSDTTWTYSRNATPWEDRKYVEEFSMAEIIQHDYLNRYCEGRSGFLWP